jgi:fumarylacetoacetase
MSVAGIDASHDSTLRSWVPSANLENCDFPIQNLPFGRFRTTDNQQWRIGIAIGDRVLDVRATGLIDHDDMNRLMRTQPAERLKLRHALSDGLREGSAIESAWLGCILPTADVELGVPCRIGDYTDFYVGIHHATAVGRLFRPDQPLLPNYKWIPIGYHGRASTIIASGTPVRRPCGQVKPADVDTPKVVPTARLDFELEMGVFVGLPNAQGAPVPLDQAETHIFGLTLFNDWSARDFQSWEYQPLGPFLSKNFASTVSPWIVTIEALAPFRCALNRPEGDPPPLEYLDSVLNRDRGGFDIQLEVAIETRAMRLRGGEPSVISRSNYAESAYWTAAQMIAHHTINGCALNDGDLLGTGTLSGADQARSGSLLELTRGGRESFEVSGERRTFLENGDSVTFRGYCERDGFRRIGFGICEGTIID